jgi:hypothetical protein
MIYTASAAHKKHVISKVASAVGHGYCQKSLDLLNRKLLKT